MGYHDRAAAEFEQFGLEVAQHRPAPDHAVVDPVDRRDVWGYRAERVHQRLERGHDLAAFHHLAGDLDDVALHRVEARRLDVDEGKAARADRLRGHGPQYGPVWCQLGGTLPLDEEVG